MRALLDVNVLLALLDADHVDHGRARGWLAFEIQHGWASCALTQNGFVRILSQPRYPSPVPADEAMRRLRRATESEYHEFWNCDLNLLDSEAVDSTRIHSPRQVTDAYLLALASSHNGRFVTFERHLPTEAARNGTDQNLVVL